MTTTLCPASARLTGKDLPGAWGGMCLGSAAAPSSLVCGTGCFVPFDERQLVGPGSSCGLTSVAGALPVRGVSEEQVGPAAALCFLPVLAPLSASCHALW